ncbi:MAG: hypothetical protein KIS80_04495 [Anaerolineales bacterium]|nr:hypothetical protein [Anaerolineales bacterium]
MNDQNLLERYIHEVGAHLPRRSRPDVQLELRSLLLDELAARGLEADNPADAAGVAELLKEYGHPEELAARYHTEQFLISPLAFPAFRLSYGIAAAVVTVVFLVGLGLRLNQGGLDLTELAGFLGSYIETMLLNFGVVAFVFYLLEGLGWIKPAKTGAGWDPHKLPAVKDPDRINRTELLVGIFFTIAALLVFNFVPHWIGIVSWHDDGIGVVPILSDQFLTYVPWLSALWVSEVALKALVYRAGRWTRRLRLAEFALSLASIYVLYTIVQNAVIAKLAIVDGIAKFALWILLGIALLESGWQLYRLLSGKANHPLGVPSIRENQ